MTRKPVPQSKNREMQTALRAEMYEQTRKLKLMETEKKLAPKKKPAVKAAPKVEEINMPEVKSEPEPSKPKNNCDIYTWREGWFNFIIERNDLPSGTCEEVCKFKKSDKNERLAIDFVTFLNEREDEKIEKEKPIDMNDIVEIKAHIIISLRVVNNKTDKEHIVNNRKGFGLSYDYLEEKGQPRRLVISKKLSLGRSDKERIAVYQDFSILEIKREWRTFKK